MLDYSTTIARIDTGPDYKGGDTLAAILALTHAVSAGGSAAFKILPATTAKICHQFCSIFAAMRQKNHHSCPALPAFSVVADIA